MQRIQGMTLLEVLVALVIFSIAALAVMKSTGQQTVGLGFLQEKMIAEWVADNQLALLLLEQRWPNDSWIKGESEMAGQKWYWRWRGVVTDLDTLKAIDIEVYTNPDYTAISSSLRTYVVKQ